MRKILLLLVFSCSICVDPFDEERAAKEHINATIAMSRLLIEEGELEHARQVLLPVRDCDFPLLAFKIVLLLDQISSNFLNVSELD